MKVYYAHCQNLYGTPQEKRDIDLLMSLGFTVENPSDQKHKDGCASLIDKMSYFCNLVHGCDALAFRCLPDGRIPAGVAAEIKQAQLEGKPVFELPTRILSRIITVEETREFLMEIGQR